MFFFFFFLGFLLFLLKRVRMESSEANLANIPLLRKKTEREDWLRAVSEGRNEEHPGTAYLKMKATR